jgi:hypothetical protein
MAHSKQKPEIHTPANAIMVNLHQFWISENTPQSAMWIKHVEVSGFKQTS